MTMLAGVLGIFFCLVCGLLILIILLQRGRGGGLAGAFGGAGGHSAFGAKTGDVFTWITVAFTVVYLFLVVMLNYVFVPRRYTDSAGADQPPAAEAPANQPESPKPPGTE